MPVPAGSGGTPLEGGSLVYDPVLSRVRLAPPGLFDGVPVRVERSTDLIRWTPVRGGAVTPTGGTIRVDDYEFAADVANHYRIIGPVAWDTFARVVSGTWTAAESGQTYTTFGGAPSDFFVTAHVGRQSNNTVNAVRGSLLDIGSSDFDYSVDFQLPIGSAPGGDATTWICGRWSNLSNHYLVRLNLNAAGQMSMQLFKRVADVLTGMPAATLGAHTAGDWWRVTFRGVGSSLTATARNTSAAGPTTTVTVTDTSLTTGTQIGLLSRLETGNTNGTVVWSWDQLVVTSPEATIYSGSIVPTLDTVWLKSLARPFLNRPVTVRDFSEVTRPSRAGVFEVVGRSYPVAVTDLRSSRRWTLDVSTYSPEDADVLDLLAASGDILLVHVPAGAGRLSATPGGYVTVGDTREVTPPTVDLAMRVFTLPCVEVAAPGPDVVGATATCQAVLSTYATCTAVLAAHPTCVSLMELVADPEDVIVS